jgi:hypothetical protein
VFIVSTNVSTSSSGGAKCRHGHMSLLTELRLWLERRAIDIACPRRWASRLLTLLDFNSHNLQPSFPLFTPLASLLSGWVLRCGSEWRQPIISSLLFRIAVLCKSVNKAWAWVADARSITLTGYTVRAVIGFYLLESWDVAQNGNSLYGSCRNNHNQPVTNNNAQEYGCLRRLSISIHFWARKANSNI